MELLFKRYFWAVWLVFLGLAALFVAKTANTFVAARLEPAPDLGLSASAHGAFVPVPPSAQVDVAKVGHLFGIEPPPPAAVADGAAAGQKPEDTTIDYSREPVKSNLRLQLLATMVANEKRWSMALISDLDKQTTDYYFVKDHLKNAVVYDIQRDPQRVVIVNYDTHQLEYIDAVPGSGAGFTANAANLGTSAIPGPPALADNDDSASNTGLDGVNRVSQGNYTITRDRLNATLGDLNHVATEARIVPSFKNGVANGFKLFSIRPGSIYSAIGIQNGDVISRINGFDINSPDKALEIYQRLKDAQNVELEVDRRGQTVKYHYSIQ